MTDLTREAITGLDSGTVLEDALALAHQLEDALWRVEAAGIEPRERAGGLIVCGMGGSAIGGDLAIGAIGERATRPLVVSRAYEPPAWTGPDTLVLCASYSGSTDETLSAFAAAGRMGAPRVALTTGGGLAEAARADGVPVIGVPAGMQPRSAVAYMAVGALVCAERSGAAPALAAEVEAAVAPLRELGERLGPDAADDSPAKSLARSLSGRVPTIYGAGPIAACARRWQTQLNENAEVDARWSELPEADHNEICAFADGGSGRAAVFLEDPGAPDLVRRRIELTAELARDSGLEVARVGAVGDSPFARVMSLVLFGDLVSIYLATLRGVDPTPVEAIDRLKRELG